MKQIITIIIFLFCVIFSYGQKTGVRAGLNLATNYDYSEGAHVGYHIAGYYKTKSFKKLDYQFEFKVQRIGYQVLNDKTVTFFYASLPVLLDIKSSPESNNSLLFGFEPGFNLGGQKVPKELYDPRYFDESIDYEQIFEREGLNIESVLGFKLDRKIDFYVFLNIGIINPDVYLSFSIGF